MVIFEKDTVLVMAGDSVTDCGRRYESEPAGWGSFGDGYVNLVNAFLCSMYPENEVMVVNRGVNGNTIVDLEKRWDKDILELNPTWVTVLIGINDVWGHFSGQLEHRRTVDEATYRRLYESIVKRTINKVSGMIILSPFMMEKNKNDEMRQMVETYAGIAREIAEKYGLMYVDLQKRMDKFLESLSSYHISQDRVHPDIKGHMIIAKTIMDAAGADWTR